MKKVVILFLATIVISWNNTNAQNFSWSQQAGSSGPDQGYDISVDEVGNVYICGWFTETAQFGTETLTSFGMQDIFIACYDTAGTFKWAKQAGADENDVSAGIVTNSGGYSFITGWFSGTADFDDQTITSVGSYDMFVAKYDPEGNCLWVNGGGGESDDYGNRITLANDGGVCIGGSFREEISLGSHYLGSQGDRDILLTHFSSEGDVVCAKSAGGAGEDRAYGIYQDEDNNYYLTGFYTGTAYFDSHELTSPAILSSFVARMDHQGVFQWVQSAAGGANDIARGFSISSDGDGNLVAIGFFSNKLHTNDHTLISNGGQFDTDMYILKFDSEGAVSWTRNAGGYGTDHARDLYVHPDGDIYLTGFFSGNSYFGEMMVESSGQADVCLAKFMPDGSIDYVISGGGTDNDYGYGVTGDNNGNLYMAGVFKVEATFGGTVLQAVGDKDIFITRVPGMSSGIYGLNENGHFVIYPNPASGEVFIDLSKGFKNINEFSYQIADMSGKILIDSGAKQHFNGEEITIDVSSFKPGPYIIKLVVDGYSLTQKLIVE